MSFKIKLPDDKHPRIETETARDAVTAVSRLQKNRNGAITVEIDDRRLSAKDKTASERDLIGREHTED